MMKSSILDLWGHLVAIYHADSITPSEVVTGPSTQHPPSLRVPVIALASPHLAFQRLGALLPGHSYSSGPKASPTCAADLAIFLKILPARHPATSIRPSDSVILVLLSVSYRTQTQLTRSDHTSLLSLTIVVRLQKSLDKHRRQPDL